VTGPTASLTWRVSVGQEGVRLTAKPTAPSVSREVQVPWRVCEAVKKNQSQNIGTLLFPPNDLSFIALSACVNCSLFANTLKLLQLLARYQAPHLSHLTNISYPLPMGSDSQTGVGTVWQHNPRASSRALLTLVGMVYRPLKLFETLLVSCQDTV